MLVDVPCLCRVCGSLPHSQVMRVGGPLGVYCPRCGRFTKWAGPESRHTVAYLEKGGDRASAMCRMQETDR